LLDSLLQEKIYQFVDVLIRTLSFICVVTCSEDAIKDESGVVYIAKLRGRRTALALSQFQEGGRELFQPSSLQSTMVPGQETMLNNVSMDCTLIQAPDVGRKVMELEKVNEELHAEFNDVKRQLASSPTEEKYPSWYNKRSIMTGYLKTTLKNKIKKFEESAAADNTSALQKKLADVKEELGRKNVAYASLKVDVEKGQLEYKRKCEILQADLDYEKSNSTRLTQEIRRYQASAIRNGHDRDPTKSPASQKSRGFFSYMQHFCHHCRVFKEKRAQED